MPDKASRYKRAIDRCMGRITREMETLRVEEGQTVEVIDALRGLGAENIEAVLLVRKKEMRLVDIQMRLRSLADALTIYEWQQQGGSDDGS